MDSYVPRAPRIELVEGSIEKTAPDFISKNSGIRISILNIDMDIYEPTLAALENFYDLVVPGGIIILDEYGIEAWVERLKHLMTFCRQKAGVKNCLSILCLAPTL